MIKLLFRGHSLFSTFRFSLTHYNPTDYATMCGLLREKYQMHNEEIQTSGFVKLLDGLGNVIGIYTASEARKKSESMGLDMVMVSLKSTPIICKAVDFRKSVLNRFFDEIVTKSNKQNLAKATSTKNIKISPTLNKNEMTVKLKQIVELSQKYATVRVFMTTRSTSKEESLGKLEEIKSQLLNKCYIEQQISSSRFRKEEEEQEEEQEEEEEPKKETVTNITFSFVVRAREKNATSQQRPQDKKDPDAIMKAFLKKYYQQVDGEMMDLKSAGLFEVDQGIDYEEEVKVKQSSKKEAPVKESTKVFEYEEEENELDKSINRQAQARVLNKRLKVLLSLSL